MDGMTALPLLLRADPGLKVIMASTLTTRGADIALRALRLGAADYVPKPSPPRHRRRDVPARAGGKGQGPGAGMRRARRAAAARRRRSPLRVASPAAACVAAAGCWRSAVRPAARRRCSPWCRAGQDAQRAGRADAAHAGDIHAHPRRAHHASSAACPAPRRRTVRRWRPAASISRRATGTCWSTAARGGLHGAARPPIRRRISAAPRSIRCCAAPPRRATAACWSRC